MFRNLWNRIKKIRNVCIPYWYLLVGPVALYWTGFAMNTLVMVCNGNQMPVFAPEACIQIFLSGDFIHSCGTSATHLKILSDWIIIRSANGVFSPGDMLEMFADKITFYGYIAWAALMIKSHNK